MQFESKTENEKVKRRNKNNAQKTRATTAYEMCAKIQQKCKAGKQQQQQKPSGEITDGRASLAKEDIGQR